LDFGMVDEALVSIEPSFPRAPWLGGPGDAACGLSTAPSPLAAKRLQCPRRGAPIAAD
tara:strand:+ start:1422 stop:1595 length:174 start_codon:yes stop_codon:yes gene_type:complete